MRPSPWHTGHVSEQRFTAAMEVGPGGGVAIRLPFDPKAAFGKVRAPVQVTITPHPPFRTTVMAYSGAAWIGLRNAQVADMGLAAGDEVNVVVEPDDAPREVEVPAELAAALEQAPAAKAAFEKLSYTRRKEYAQWVAEAKREATRASRVAKTIEQLS